HDGGARTPERQRVQKVRDRRADTPQQARDRPGHPQFLAPRWQVQRLDAFGHELGPARNRGEAKIVCDPRKRAQELLDVRLVAGPLPAEHVGVDHHERLAPATSSLYTPKVMSATDFQAHLWAP